MTWAGAALAAALAYAFFVGEMGWGLPCPFHAVTGAWCPGCGATRMCLALLRLDFPAAWAANPGLLLLLPFLLLFLGSLAYRYVRSGARDLTRGQSAAVWAMVAFLLLYGVLRNLPPFSFLAPA